MHSVMDKADRCDSPILRNRRTLASSPPHGSYSPLNIRCGKVSSFRWAALRILDFGLLCSVSHRLCQQSVPGQSQEEPRRKERARRGNRGRERETGGGGSHRDPLEEPRGFCRTACASAYAHSREVAWRGTKEVVGARSRWWFRQPRIINCVSASPAPPRLSTERGHADPQLSSSLANIHV